MRRLYHLLALLPLCAGPVLAETFPVPKVDPHASSWGKRGSFTLFYFGELKDGSACPASPNALKYAIADEDGKLVYLHAFNVDKEVDADLRAPFEVGTFCSLAFDGEVRFLMHHGTQAAIRPTVVSPPEETPDS